MGRAGPLLLAWKANAVALGREGAPGGMGEGSGDGTWWGRVWMRPAAPSSPSTWVESVLLAASGPVWEAGVSLYVV